MAGAVLEPDSEEIDIAALHQGYLRGLRARGGTLMTEAAVTALTRNGGLWQAETPVGAFAAPVVVNAAGAGATPWPHLRASHPSGFNRNAARHSSSTGRRRAASTAGPWSTTSRIPFTSSRTPAGSWARPPTRSRPSPATPIPKSSTSPSAPTASCRRRPLRSAHPQQVGGPPELRRGSAADRGLRPCGPRLLLGRGPGRRRHHDCAGAR